MKFDDIMAFAKAITWMFTTMSMMYFGIAANPIYFIFAFILIVLAGIWSVKK